MLLAVTDAATKRHSTKVGVFLVAVKNLEIPLKNIFNEIDGLDILFLPGNSLLNVYFSWNRRTTANQTKFWLKNYPTSTSVNTKTNGYHHELPSKLLSTGGRNFTWRNILSYRQDIYVLTKTQQSAIGFIAIFSGFSLTFVSRAVVA